MPNQYLVAKYAPDVRRMEPQNIGIILWADGIVASRFVSEKDAPFLKDVENYRRWIEFWRLQLTSEEFAPIRGKPVPKSSPQFLNALKSEQGGNFILFDGGRISTAVKPNEVDDAVQFLFDDIVSRRRVVEEHDSLAEVAERAIQDAGISEKIETQYKVNCKLFGVPQDVTVNYAVVDDNPLAFMQRVSVKKQQTAVYAASVFHFLTESKQVNKKHCASLINSADGESPKVLKMLEKTSTVIDLSNTVEAIRALKKMADAA